MDTLISKALEHVGTSSESPIDILISMVMYAIDSLRWNIDTIILHFKHNTYGAHEDIAEQRFHNVMIMLYRICGANDDTLNTITKSIGYVFSIPVNITFNWEHIDTRADGETDEQWSNRIVKYIQMKLGLDIYPPDVSKCTVWLDFEHKRFIVLNIIAKMTEDTDVYVASGLLLTL